MIKCLNILMCFCINLVSFMVVWWRVYFLIINVNIWWSLLLILILLLLDENYNYIKKGGDNKL